MAGLDRLDPAICVPGLMAESSPAMTSRRVRAGSLKTFGELVIPLDLSRTAGMCVGATRVGNQEQPNTAEAKWLKPEDQV
jgi:hypothetical protein